MKGRTALACLVAMMMLLGCNTQAKWTYPVNPQNLYKTSGEGSNLTIAVLPFREDRPVRNRSATFLLYLIPLMPFGWVTYERPEAARMFNTIASYEMQLDEDLAKAAARSLEQSGLVRKAYFTFGGETREADYVLRGTAEETRYYGRIISYGLSVYGPLLWFVGLPAGTSANAVRFSLVLEDLDGEEVWRHEFSGETSITQGLYYNWGNDTINFAVLMEKAMNRSLADLDRALPALERRALEHRRTLTDPAGAEPGSLR